MKILHLVFLTCFHAVLAMGAEDSLAALRSLEGDAYRVARDEYLGQAGTADALEAVLTDDPGDWLARALLVRLNRDGVAREHDAAAARLSDPFADTATPLDLSGADLGHALVTYAGGVWRTGKGMQRQPISDSLPLLLESTCRNPAGWSRAYRCWIARFIWRPLPLDAIAWQARQGVPDPATGQRIETWYPQEYVERVLAWTEGSLDGPPEVAMSAAAALGFDRGSHLLESLSKQPDALGLLAAGLRVGIRKDGRPGYDWRFWDAWTKGCADNQVDMLARLIVVDDRDGTRVGATFGLHPILLGHFTHHREKRFPQDARAIFDRWVNGQMKAFAHNLDEFPANSRNDKEAAARIFVACQQGAFSPFWPAESRRNLLDGIITSDARAKAIIDRVRTVTAENTDLAVKLESLIDWLEMEDPYAAE